MSPLALPIHAECPAGVSGCVHGLGTALSMASTACRKAGDASSNFNAIFMVLELSFDTSPSILELTPNRSFGVISNVRHKSEIRSTRRRLYHARISGFAGRSPQGPWFGSVPVSRVAYGSLIRSSYQLANRVCAPRLLPVNEKPQPDGARAKFRNAKSVRTRKDTHRQPIHAERRTRVNEKPRPHWKRPGLSQLRCADERT